MAIVIRYSTITGIHRTKVSSQESIYLDVEMDNSIPDIDPMCMKVVFPANVPAAFRDEVTWPKNPDHNWSSSTTFQEATYLLSTK